MPIDLTADLAAIMADGSGVAVDATYTPAGGSPVAVRVIPRQPDVAGSFADTNFVSQTSVFSVAVAAVAAPRSGDQITVGGVVHTVQGVPMRDPRRLLWRIEARPA